MMGRGALLAAIALTGMLLSDLPRDLQLAEADPPAAGTKAPRDENKESSDGEEGESSDGTIDPTGPNSACYVCHITFVREGLSKSHLRKKIGCIKCHGTSIKHVNDEDIGASKPDVTYRRDQVNAACRKCHEQHDVPPESVIARWLERKLTRAPAVCTDCHGAHRIEPIIQGAKND